MGLGEGVVAGNGAVGRGVSGGCSSRWLEDDCSCMGGWGGGGFEDDFSCMGGWGGGCVACTEEWDNVGSKGGSCKLESDSGGGAGRSNVDAAQSQWDERLP